MTADQIVMQIDGFRSRRTSEIVVLPVKENLHKPNLQYHGYVAGRTRFTVSEGSSRINVNYALITKHLLIMIKPFSTYHYGETKKAPKMKL